MPVLQTNEQIIDVEIDAPFISVLHEGIVVLYDNNFEVVNSFVIDNNVRSLRQLAYIDSTFINVRNENDDVVLVQHNWDGTSNEIYRAPSGHEMFTGIEALNSKSFLLEGILEVPEVEWFFQRFGNAFMRYIDLNDVVPYEKIDLAITDYKIDQITKDSVIAVVNPVSYTHLTLPTKA